MALRVLFAGAYRAAGEVEALRNARIYKRDKDGKFSSGGGGGEGTGEGGTAADLSLEDFAGGATGSDVEIRQQLRAQAAERVAQRWDVSAADLEATIRESGYWDNYKDMPLEQQKKAFIEERIKEWSSGAHPLGVLMLHGAATEAGAHFALSAEHQGVVKFARDHPAIGRATGSLGRAMYAETQSWFAERGITAVKAKRATMKPDAESDNLYTSWSLQRESGFIQTSQEHTVVRADIPVARIFSIPSTGLGSYEEAELVVMPGSG